MAGSMMPPDIREQMKSRGQSGIGGAARENAETARQRQIAMGQVPEDEVQEAAVEEEEDKLLKICPSPRCGVKLDDEWNFCAKCGQELLRPGFAASKLGITFTEKDVQDYIFKGFVVRELKFLGAHTVTIKSSQAKDLDEIDNFIMNGKWAKDDAGQERKISDFYLRQMNHLCVTATSVLRIDDSNIGADLESRFAYIKDKGSAFVDMLSERVVLLNRALTDYLRRIDTVTGS